MALQRRSSLPWSAAAGHAVAATSRWHSGTIYQYIKDGAFPKPVRLGPRAVGWLEADVSDWITTGVKFARVDARLAA